MRNLWIFINRYNAFFLFIIFFTVGIVLTVKNNIYQRSVTLNSTNEIVGEVYQNLNVATKYMNLGKVNDSLSIDNARLSAQLFAVTHIDSAKNETVKDTISNYQYTYLPARIIKNSITLRNNIITINKGSADGIQSGMAVISPIKGVVGFIRDVSPHLATIQSLLHKDTRMSVNLKKNNALGSLVWGEKNFDFRKAFVKEIPNQFKINIGDTVITSGYGAFPPGIPVGRVSNTAVATGDNFMTIEIRLLNDFSTLQYVYVIKNKFAEEVKILDDKIPHE